MKQFLQKNKIIFIILLAALVIRLIYFGIIVQNFGEAGFYITKNGDSLDYYNEAKNILERGIFSSADAPPFSLENFRTPGYPAFIIIFYKIIPSVVWVIFWQNIIFVGFIFAVWLFLKKYFSQGAATIAAVFLSFEPSIIYLNNQLLSENIFTIAVFAAFVFSIFAIRGRSYFAAISGLCLAAALYLRPIGQYLAVIFIIFYLAAALARKISWKKFVLLILLSTLSFSAAIFPWLARNKKDFGYYNMATSSSITLSRYAFAIASNLKESDGWIGDSASGPLVRYIVLHPVIFGKVYIMSLAMFFGGDSYLLVFDRLWPGLENQRLQEYWPRTFPQMYNYLWGHKGAEAVIFWLGKIIRIAIVSLFLAGIYFGFKDKKNRFILFGMGLIIFYLTLAAGAVSYTRFRFAVEPYIYAFVGFTAVNILHKFKNEKKKKILFIAGARPNFMKISAMTLAASAYKDKIEPIIIHTGQHYSDELSKIFFEEFKMPAPAVNLGVGSCSRKEQIAKILQELPKHIGEIKPDLIAVVGDVNSTVAAALAGAAANIPVAHIEAGLRSFNWKMPEEINRVMTDHLSDLLFVTEESAVENLKNEAVPQEKIYLVGNVMIDTLLRFSGLAEHSKVLEINNLRPKEYALVTLHRAENVDDLARLKDLVSAMEEIGKNIILVCPLHPRTVVAFSAAGIKPNFKIIPPQPYFDFLKLQKNAKFIITDSGGIQEEASILRIPCITVRTETERPATVKWGTNEVVGVEYEKIIAAAKRAASGDWKVGRDIPLWDGRAAERIMKIIVKYLGV